MNCSGLVLLFSMTSVFFNLSVLFSVLNKRLTLMKILAGYEK